MKTETAQIIAQLERTIDSLAAQLEKQQHSHERLKKNRRKVLSAHRHCEPNLCRFKTRLAEMGKKP